MKKKPAKLFALVICILGISIPMLAHHGNSGYDLSKTVTLNGTISSFDWGNPHCLIHIDVKDDNGIVRHWTLELGSPFAMSRKGWTKDSLRLGDQAVIDTHPAKNGTSVGITATSGSIMNVVVNGKPLSK